MEATAKQAAFAAAIDLGSNTFRLLVAQAFGTGFSPVVKELATVRLSRGLRMDGVLGSAAMERGLKILAGFAEIIADYRPHCLLRACGTHALRQAANRADFLESAGRVLGVAVEVLSGDEEARLTLLGVRSFMKPPLEGPYVLVDVGGGSTEVIQADANHAGSVTVSIPIGAVGLTESFFKEPRPTEFEVDLLRQFVAGRLLSLDGDLIQADRQIVASGGTATALAALDLGLGRYDAARVQGHRLSKAGLDALCIKLAGLSVSERNGLAGLEEGRGEIVLAGALIYQSLLDLTGAPFLVISDAGLLEGILLSTREGVGRFF